MRQIRTYDTTEVRREFDYMTGGWRDCPVEGLRRIKSRVEDMAALLPSDDPRHLIANEILEKIQGKETP